MHRPRRGLLRLAALLLAVPLVAAPAAAPAYADGSTGSISGHLDTNGVPRTDVYVTLYGAQGWIGSVNVDGSGIFHFTDLAPGQYQVEFGWGNGLRQWYHSRPVNSQTDPVTVVAGQDTAIQDDTLPTGHIAGTLTDSGGSPMPYTEAYASSPSGAGSAFAFTDPAGHYDVEVIAADYVLSFMPQGYATDYVPQSPSQDHATVFTVTAGTTLTVNEQLPPTGSISGRFTTADGQPVAGAFVQASIAGQGGGGYATTGADGTYQIPHVYAATYHVSFIDPGFTHIQYAFGKLTDTGADPITVTANADTVVNDSQLPTGSISVTATDAVTHQPIADFCAGADGQQACSNGTGTAVVTNVRQGRESYYVYTNDGHYFGVNDQSVTVTGGATTTVAVALRPGATIDTVVKDAVTGAPVPNTCVGPMAGTTMVVPDGFGYCSDAQGILHIGPLEAASYALYVRAPGDPYGDQFVGDTGGTGSLERARRVSVVAGQTVTLPAIALDHAGTVTGTVTDSSGRPVTAGLVSNSAVEPGPGPTGRVAAIDSTGHYTLTGLGPYAWPLFFSADNQAPQWSGGVGDRTDDARPVRVVRDATVTFDARLAAGVAVTGTVRSGGALVGPGRVIAYNAKTGDPIGVAEVNQGSYRLLVVGGQTIKLRYETYEEGKPQGWYGGSDFAHAKRVEVGRKAFTLNLTVG
jgi:hypothetical protein